MPSKVKTIEKVAKKLGFQKVSQKGSHARWQHIDWCTHLWRYLVQTPTDFQGFDRSLAAIARSTFYLSWFIFRHFSRRISTSKFPFEEVVKIY